MYEVWMTILSLLVMVFVWISTDGPSRECARKDVRTAPGICGGQSQHSKVAGAFVGCFN